MSILSDAQKNALVGRLLGIPEQPASANSTEKVPPTGTVAGTEPLSLANATSNKGLLLVAGVLAVLGVVFLARKVL